MANSKPATRRRHTPAPPAKGKIRATLALVFFIGAMGCLVANIFFAHRYIAEIATEDREIARILPPANHIHHHRHWRRLLKQHQSAYHQYHRYRRSNIKQGRDGYFEGKSFSFNVPKLGQIELSPAQIALLGPLTAAIYFLLSSQLAEKLALGAWLGFLGRMVGHLTGRTLPTNFRIPPLPAVPMEVTVWLKRGRRWCEWLLAAAIVASIISSIALVDELRLPAVAPRYVMQQNIVNIVGFSGLILFFFYRFACGRVAAWMKGGVSPVRRGIIAAIPLIGLAALFPTGGQALAPLVEAGHFSKPRFRTRKRPQRQVATLAHGVYRNPKSGTILYIDEKGNVACRQAINTHRLIRVSNLTEADFPKISHLAAKILFEKQALSALEKQKTTDAVAWLDLGVRYQIYRRGKDRKFSINMRVVKLFAGLCYRHKVKGHIPAIRRKLVEQGMLAAFQPATEGWLTHPGDFKKRWQIRRTYGGIPL
jgi:hypothetical protein